ncbi:hypothetical protein [Variovorax ginsengisoli]|uniref:Uncharacterized protein n=1 Tax=Variovorax ginsengisoli TaxID=363844 RepID=A0ABT8SDI2_9BURK|nr:hypothetical protein [Variovorax ginsengisoli]MDN8617811.1 hypothetical protein [Variovorax ginsengisoli]MDO1536981.1 hypothetical protein [Variovorax ginsengisoli]
MSHVQHEHPLAIKAATEVDPLILANALDHIRKTAGKSRTSTRRLRWIEQRALFALRGDEYRDIDLDLPKDAGPNTQEKLKRRMDFHIAVKHAHAEALRQLVDVCERMDLHGSDQQPSEEEYQQVLAVARGLLASGNQLKNGADRHSDEPVQLVPELALHLPTELRDDQLLRIYSDPLAAGQGSRGAPGLKDDVRGSSHLQHDSSGVERHGRECSDGEARP